jgi:carbon storage regulator
MLLLSRKVGQRIHIGNDVTLVVLDVHGNRVRLGFEAPAQVSINREEVVGALGKGRARGQQAARQLQEAVGSP